MWICMQVRGALFDHMRESFEQLQDSSALQYVGVSVHSHSDDDCGLSRQQEDEISNLAGTFLVALVMRRTVRTAWMLSWPTRFVLLGSDIAEERSDTLVKLKQEWNDYPAARTRTGTLG